MGYQDWVSCVVLTGLGVVVSLICVVVICPSVQNKTEK